MSSKGQSSEKSTRRFTAEDLEAVDSSEKEQFRFKGWVEASKGFSENEKAAFKVDSVAAFIDYWEHTNSAKESFDRSQGKGCGLLGKRYQSSASFVLPFMNDFSPIIQIVKDLGAPYGGLAVGTLSLLFAVAGNKDEMEKSLASAILSIRDRLPGLKLYQHIYNEESELDQALQNQIVLAYRSFMDFCIMATKYYKGGGRRRWLRAILPASSFADKADDVERHIVKIRRLCEELLNKNVDNIKRSNEGLKDDNIELKAQIIVLQKGHDHDRLNEVQRFLDLDDYSEEQHRKEWETHVRAVDRDEEINTEILQQMRGPELDTLRAREDYQAWSNSEQSCLLILSGYNDISIDRAYQCWLSPIAEATLNELGQRKPRPFYAYHALPQQGKLLFAVLSVFLLQLLRQKSSVLRDERRYAELRTQLGKLHQTEMDEDDRISAVESIAIRVIDFFDESEVLYIVMDRADRCRDPKKADADHRKTLLRVFVKMVEAARCRLKILTVVNGRDWRVENYRNDLGAKMMERLIVCTVEQRVRDW